MGLRLKVFLSIGIVLTSSFVLINSLLTHNIEKGFLELERQELEKNTERITNALQNKIDELSVKLGDWSQWDDTYVYITERNEAYIQSNLQVEAFELLRVDFVVLTDLAGNIIFEKYVQDGEERPFPESLSRHLMEDIASGDITTSPGTAHQEMISVPEGIIITVIRPVTSGDGRALANGFIVFAFFFNEDMARDISHITRVPMDYASYDTPSLESDFAEAREHLSVDNPFFMGYSLDGERVFGYTWVKNESGDPVLLLRAQMNREIYEKGLGSVALFSKTMIIIGALFTAITFFLFYWLVLRKLFFLKNQVATINIDDISDQQISLPGSDEFSELARDTNGMVLMLRDRNRFLEGARREISNIMENVVESEDALRKQTEELQKFHLAVDKSFNHTVITDPDGNILYANEAAVLLTGFSLDEMRGKTPSLWGKQMSREFYVEMWHRIKKEKKSFFGEITNKKKDGSLYIASVRIIPIVGDDGEVNFFVATETDITEIKKQEDQEAKYIENLEVANQKITTEKVRAEAILRYLRSIGEAVFATDKAGTIVFSNVTAARMVGLAPEDIIGKESHGVFRFCIGSSDKSCDFLPFYEAIKFKKTLSFSAESFLMGKDGKKIPISGTLSPIIEVKHIAGAIVVFQDITDRYELEQMKDRFLSVAAHQLRTPLGSMRWTMELLEDGDLGKLPKQAKEAVVELRKNSNRMMLLINDLLNVSRINQSEVREGFSDVNILDIAKEAVSALQSEAEKKSIIVKVETTKKPLPKISLIRKHIFEAVQNLISNAIRYGKENGNIQMRLFLENGYLVILIADDGIGIPKDAQSNIFSKFFRAENAVKYFTDGSGLGLSVVKFYVEESNGEISFESEENVGTTFVIKFPVK